MKGNAGDISGVVIMQRYCLSLACGSIGCGFMGVVIPFYGVLSSFNSVELECYVGMRQMRTRTVGSSAILLKFHKF